MNIRINCIFWKEGPLLFGFAQSKLPRLLACQSNNIYNVEPFDTLRASPDT